MAWWGTHRRVRVGSDFPHAPLLANREVLYRGLHSDKNDWAFQVSSLGSGCLRGPVCRS